jgi:hypothetical protein
MLTSVDRLKYEFEKIVNEDIERITQQIAAGYMPDYETYRHFQGILAGLKSSLILFGEAEAVASGQKSSN